MIQKRLESLKRNGVRVGAVTYLNARPLVEALGEIDPTVEMVFDHPSRLADSLAAGRLDVAMIPSIEYARQPGYSIISDACIACDGPVRSVKLYGRTAVEDVCTLALDEGSRTSAALARILLKERFGVTPETRPLPIGASLEDSSADAALMIGNRGIAMADGDFEFVWDLGWEWSRWTGLPFVFALWIARPGVDLHGVGAALAQARDVGLGRLEEIARREAPKVGLSERECLSYLRDNLKFHFGPRQRQGLERFFALAGRHGLAPKGVQLAFHDDVVV
ncbi:MAG: menaquinone biosynthesis protein [Planctomycetes bacterium]|nr:menaquinone biosynthesis protein [Planctomycetota bacterium]MBU4399635.1 menaquinone biosynthesis protein [Planctomycetota bacterium]MCG2683921.1 menaquinone biosynthesis protein [Planctomycetales bacterium]